MGICYNNFEVNMKEIIFVTSNPGKVQSAQKHIAQNISLKIYEYDIDEPDVNDIEYIAEYKLRQAFEKVKKPCLSLDAGFYIPNFPGKPNFPGAFPKRELLYKFGIEGLLERMKDVKDRECYFKECLAYYDGKEVKKFFAFVRGNLSTEIRGRDTKQKWSDLWYVFIPQNCTKTMAEMTEDERAHRNDGYVSPFDLFNEWFDNEKDIL